jgi:hypothetical protein
MILVLFMVLACVSEPKPAETAPPVTQQEQQSEPVVMVVTVTQEPPAPPPPVTEAVFDPHSISHEKYELAKADVQKLINDLNRIIRAKNYNAWITYLADSYLRYISSQTFLEEKTEDLYKRDQIVATNLGRDPKMVEKRILKNARDYFEYVVVPSRSNDRLDDIDFVLENRVKAYTMDNRGNRLVLYDFEIINNKWKIVS